LLAILTTLGFNIAMATLYMLAFFVVTRCFGKPNKEALNPDKRTNSFYQRMNQKQEKMILNDIL
jgi:hypothetical protein